jgi:hypothetical protein
MREQGLISHGDMEVLRLSDSPEEIVDLAVGPAAA